METFQFHQGNQNSGGKTDQFFIRLSKLADRCKFHDVDNEIKSAIDQDCRSKYLRRYALQTEKLTLAALPSTLFIIFVLLYINRAFMQNKTASFELRIVINACPVNKG